MSITLTASNPRNGLPSHSLTHPLTNSCHNSLHSAFRWMLAYCDSGCCSRGFLVFAFALAHEGLSMKEHRSFATSTAFYIFLAHAACSAAAGIPVEGFDGSVWAGGSIRTNEPYNNLDVMNYTRPNVARIYLCWSYLAHE